MSLSFKQYLVETRAQLVTALDRTPRVLMEYQIKHYCSIPAKTADTEGIGFKPSMTIVVEWDISDDRREPVSVVLESAESTINLPLTLWNTTDRLTKWLNRHTKGERNREHYVNRF